MTAYKAHNTGIELPISFGVMFLVNIVGIYLANLYYPKMVVVGTFGLTSVEALLLSAGVLAAINAFLIPLFHVIENSRKKMLTDKEWMLGYAIMNTVVLWLITRIPTVFGLGISSWIPLVSLALVLNFLQGLGMVAYGKIKQAL